MLKPLAEERPKMTCRQNLNKYYFGKETHLRKYQELKGTPVTAAMGKQDFANPMKHRSRARNPSVREARGLHSNPEKIRTTQDSGTPTILRGRGPREEIDNYRP